MADRTVFKAYITKCALTAGIQEREVEDCFNTSPGMVRDLGSAYFASFHGEGREWHRTREGAAKRANEMRTDKIKSLEKSIAKLRKMEF